MQLLVIRHALAQSREEFAGEDDALRPLTKDGLRQMRRGAKGLRRIVGDIDDVYIWRNTGNNAFHYTYIAIARAEVG